MNKFILKIDGMKCSMCEEHVSTIIKDNIDRAIIVKASHVKNNVIISSDRDISEEEFKQVFLSSGYKVLDYQNEMNLKDSFIFNFKKKHYKFYKN